eukprot:4220166-Lingulodinium_polyedra.AAC.1
MRKTSLRYTTRQHDDPTRAQETEYQERPRGSLALFSHTPCRRSGLARLLTWLMTTRAHGNATP